MYIDRDDRIHCADDGDHTVRIFDTAGNLQQMLGESGRAARTGFEIGECPVLFGGKPFNGVTNVAKSPNGDIYVADGCGNARVHRFAADGTLISSWGSPGSNPGEFNLPHGIAVDRASRGLCRRPRELARADLRPRRRLPEVLGLG